MIIDLKTLELNDFTENINFIVFGLTKILENLQENVSKAVNSFRSEENLNLGEGVKAGFFMPTFCGHGGQFTQKEIKTYEGHLFQSHFLQ